MDWMKLPPLSALRAFSAFSEAGSLAGAGRLLNVSHAAISQQLKALEEFLGLSLLTREGRVLGLTEDGQKLSDTLKLSFSAIGRVIEELSEADRDRPLHITTTPMFAASWLMPRIAEFRHAHPSVDVMLDPTVKSLDLSPGGIDIAIRFGNGNWAGADAELLLRTEFVIAAPKALVDGRRIDSPDDLLDLPWLHELGTTEVNDWLKSKGVTSCRVKGSTLLPGNLLLDGLRAGQGIAATTRSFIEQDVASGEIVILFEDPDPGYGYFIVHRDGALRPPAKAFKSWLRQQARALRQSRPSQDAGC